MTNIVQSIVDTEKASLRCRKLIDHAGKINSVLKHDNGDNACVLVMRGERITMAFPTSMDMIITKAGMP